jgi:hypothetical protein
METAMSDLVETTPEPESNAADVVIQDGKAQDLTPKTDEVTPKDDDAAQATDAVDADSDGDAETPEESEPKPKPKKSSVQERIDQLTAQRHEAERKARDAEARARKAEERLTRQREIPEDDYDAQSAEAVRRTINEDAREDALYERQEALIERQELTAKTFFTKVDAAFGDKAGEFVNEFKSLPVTPTSAEILAESEVGAEMAYWLTKNPNEAVRIARLNDLQQVRELTKLEARVTAAPKARRQTQAPPPPKTIEASGSSGAKDPASMTDAEYSQWYRDRQKNKR